MSEANWHSLAQIEGDCITPIFKMIDNAGKKWRFFKALFRPVLELKIKAF